MVACPTCGKKCFNVKNVEQNGAELEFRISRTVNDGPCPACVEASFREMQRREKQVQLNAIFPATFNSTDESRLPADQLTRALAWSPTLEKPNLLLHGPTGLCKTRVAVVVAKRMAMKSTLPPSKLVWMPAVEFSHNVQSKFGGDGNGVGWVRGLANCGLLLIDDLGKGKLTDRVQSELFGLIDNRFSNGRATIITCNAAGTGIEDSFNEDIGAPLVRRLREFSYEIGFKS